jgi:hypothetical protein
MEVVVNHSRRFLESPRSIDTLCSVSQRTATPEKRKIGEQRTRLSILLRISEKVSYETHQYLNWLSKIEIIYTDLQKSDRQSINLYIIIPSHIRFQDMKTSLWSVLASLLIIKIKLFSQIN